MKAHFSRFMPQPLTAIVISILALIILIAPWVDTPALVLDTITTHTGLIAIFLAIAIISAGIYPIHFQRNIKVFLTTVPLYVAAMLLPPAVAALTAGISTLIVQMLTRSHSGNTPSDIATASGRWVIIAFLSAWVAQRATSRTDTIATGATERCGRYVHWRYHHWSVGDRFYVGRTTPARDRDFAARSQPA